MKKFIVASILFLLSVYAFSQIEDSFDIKRSDVLNFQIKGRMANAFRLSNNKIAMVREIRNTISVAIFNEDMTIKEQEKELSFISIEKKTKVYFKGIYLTHDDKAIVFFEKKFKKLKKSVVYANVLNFETQTFELPKPLIITEIFYKKQIKNYEFSFSEDKTKFVFINYVKRGGNNFVNYRVYNSDLELQWETQLDDIFVKRAPAGIFKIANNGKLVTMVPVRDETVGKRDKTKQKSLFFLYVHDNEGNIEDNMYIKMKQFIILNDFDMKIDKNNKLIAGACYKQKTTHTFSSGVMNFSIDLNNVEEPEYRIYEFPLDLLKKYETASIGKRYDEAVVKNIPVGLNYLNIADIISHENGYFVIMEKAWAMSQNGAVSYINNDYIVVSYSNDGELLGFNRVPKGTMSGRANYYNNNIFYFNGDLYFINFDSSKNYNKGAVEKGEKYYHSDCIGLQIIKKNGELVRKKIYVAKDLGLSSRAFVVNNVLIEKQKTKTTYLFYSGLKYTILDIDLKK